MQNFKRRYVYEYVYFVNPVTKVININYLNFGRYAMHIQHQTSFWIAIHVTIYWLDTPLPIPPICNDVTCTKCSYQVSLYYVLWYGSRIVWRHYIKHMPFMYDIDFAVMTYLYLNRCMGLICVLVNGACKQPLLVEFL